MDKERVLIRKSVSLCFGKKHLIKRTTRIFTFSSFSHHHVVLFCALFLFEQRKQRHVHASSSQSVVVFVVDVFFFFVLFPSSRRGSSPPSVYLNKNKNNNNMNNNNNSTSSSSGRRRSSSSSSKLKVCAAMSSIDDPNFADLSDRLKLDNVRQSLIRQEDSIIFALIERSQYKVNDKIYKTNSVDVPCYDAKTGVRSSMIEFMLREREQMMGKSEGTLRRTNTRFTRKVYRRWLYHR